MSVPVLLLVFNRPVHTRAVIDRLREVRPARLYVHSDGPRPGIAGEAEKVAAVRDLIDGVDWACEVKPLFRDSNFGLKKGVSDALDWFFGQEEYGIVLEDDCLPDPTFFPFCAELLEKYRHDEQVMHIAGSNLAQARTAGRPESYVFSRFSFVWGWASWSRAWRRMSLSLDGLDGFTASGTIRSFIPGRMAQVYMLEKFYSVRAGKLNSWAYAWFYSILNNKGLCIVPARNLVQNTGVGEEGATNTTGRNEAARLRASALHFPLQHPDSQIIDPDLERVFFHATQKKKYRLWIWFVMRFLRR